ncbi:hypothetical protein CRE_17603 [Caenorhabditis remanei]|uniref:Uncharacterized protein n=1 Tax=Caenorhabditis remanei TaxID=31234 RepID=E3NHB6_CAERE|nr:hypothetical protein CRE_17603 [Caenorhabditis remanei]
MSSNSSLSSNDSFLNEKPKDIVFFSPLETSTPTKSVKKTVEIRDLSPIVRGAPTRIERCFQRFVQVSVGTKLFVDDTYKFFSNLVLPQKTSDLLSDSSLESEEETCSESESYSESEGSRSSSNSDGYDANDEDSNYLRVEIEEESTLYVSISSEEEEAYDADKEDE